MKNHKKYVAAVLFLCMIFFLNGCSQVQERFARIGQDMTDKKREQDDVEESGSGMDQESEPGMGTETETESKTETETEPESETETETEPGTESEPETEEYWNGYTVGIDPGHQGSWIDMSAQEPDGPGSSNYKAKSTAGTTGRYTGVPEYQLNLDISLKLRDVLEERGYHVVMTREDNDTAISNIERAQKAAEGGSDIYVRIHANGSDDPSVDGALAMVPSPENPYISHLAGDSCRLAQCILNDYCEETNFSNLGIQYYDNMTGINWSKVPVMILEMGFMTNEGDDYAMQDDRVQEKMVEGIVRGIDDYFGIEKDGLIEDPETEKGEEKRINEKDSLAQDVYREYLAKRETMGEKWAFACENLTSHEASEYNGKEMMQSASVIKVFIMGAVYDRMCYPSSPDRLISANESYDGELRSLLEQMITVSSNEAANELIERLGEGDFYRGAAVVNQFCVENGYLRTSVGRRFMETDPVGDNYTSAGDCIKILEDIYEGSCVNKTASARMLDLLREQTNKSKIPAGLPGGVDSANKTGEMPEGYRLGCIENDIAIVFAEDGDYILALLSNDLSGRNEEAKQVIAQISGYVYRNFAQVKG